MNKAFDPDSPENLFSALPSDADADLMRQAYEKLHAAYKQACARVRFLEFRTPLEGIKLPFPQKSYPPIVFEKHLTEDSVRHDDWPAPMPREPYYVERRTPTPLRINDDLLRKYAAIQDSAGPIELPRPSSLPSNDTPTPPRGIEADPGPDSQSR